MFFFLMKAIYIHEKKQKKYTDNVYTLHKDPWRDFSGVDSPAQNKRCSGFTDSNKVPSPKDPAD